MRVSPCVAGIAALLITICEARSPTVAQQLPTGPQQPPTFRSRAQAVEVDVRVTDREGRPVRDLSADDFVILENGQRQAIDTVSFVDLETLSPITREKGEPIGGDVVSNSGTGRMWVLLLGNTFGNRGRLVARSFVQQALGPYDEVAVVHALGNMSAAQGFTRNRRLLLDAVDRIGQSPSNPGADPLRSMYNVLEDLSLRLGAFKGRRKAIVFFDPPAFLAPSMAVSPNEVSLAFDQRDALRAATRNNVTIYVVSTVGLTTELTPSGQQGSPRDPLRNRAGQRLLAEETGGQALLDSNNYKPAFERFVRDTSAYYVLGYVPPVETPDGSFHEISVQVRRPGVTVRARRGYYAERPRPDVAGSPAGPSSGIQDALRLPLAVGGLSIDLFAAPFKGGGRDGQVLLGAQVSGGDLVLAPRETIEIGYQALTTEGRLTPGSSREVVLNFSDTTRARVEDGGLRLIESITLPKGRHQVRFAVHQPNGRTGMVLADVDVPDFEQAPVSLSGVLMASERTAEQPSLVGDPALLERWPVKPTARRRFSPDEGLTSYFEVYVNSNTRMEAVQVRATVNRLDDTVRQEVPLTSVVSETRRVGYVTELPGNLREGQHLLSVEARAGKRTALRQVVFTIAR